MSYQNPKIQGPPVSPVWKDYAASPLTRRQATMKRSTRTPTDLAPCRTVSIPIGLKINERTDRQHIDYLLKRLAALAWLKRMAE